jgi:hypothetical protein
MQSTEKQYLLPFLTHVTPDVEKALFSSKMEECDKYHLAKYKENLRESKLLNTLKSKALRQNRNVIILIIQHFIKQ